MPKRSFYEEVRKTIKSNFFIYRDNDNLTIDEISVQLNVSRDFVYRVVKELSSEIAAKRGNVELANAIYHSELLKRPELSHPGPRDQTYRLKRRSPDSFKEVKPVSSGGDRSNCSKAIDFTSSGSNESDFNHMPSNITDDNFISSLLCKFENLNTELNEIKTIIKGE